MTHTRLEQLSDGIFAIVMTLLVMQIHIPNSFGMVSNRHIWNELVTMLPLFLSYLLSFSLLFTYWRAHHFFITIYAKNIDTKLTNINALFFMLVSLVPFSAELLGTYSRNELVIAVFGIHIILIGLTLYWMRHYVLYSEHIKNPEITHHEILGSTIRTMVPVFSALVAIALSFVNTKASLTLFTLAILFNFSSTSTRLLEKLFRVR